MKEIEYTVYKEGKYFVAQCVDVDISSFGGNKKEAIENIKEVVGLYFETMIKDEDGL